MAYGYVPDLGISSRPGRRLGDFGEGAESSQMAFQQPVRGQQGAADVRGYEGQQPGNVYQQGPHGHADN